MSRYFEQMQLPRLRAELAAGAASPPPGNVWPAAPHSGAGA